MAVCRRLQKCAPAGLDASFHGVIGLRLNVSKVGQWQAQEFTSYTWNTGLVRLEHATGSRVCLYQAAIYLSGLMDILPGSLSTRLRNC